MVAHRQRRASGQGRKPAERSAHHTQVGACREVAGEGGGEASGSGASRANLYDEVTGRIIMELEAGRFPWVQP